MEGNHPPPHCFAFGKSISAACEVFEGITRRYGKPEFGIADTKIHGLTVPVREETVWSKPFCNLIHFDRDEKVCGKRYDPKVLLVAPMSGHYATLLRGTVQAMIPEHNLYITDWVDARDVPLYEGRFDLDDFIDYIVEMVQFLGPNTHVMAVCQPSVPVLAATAVMAANDDPCQPASLTLMGGPIDTRRNPTVVNNLAEKKSMEWFERSVINRVPFPNAGAMRKVYPGFIQLTGFMTMNLERHRDAHTKLYDNLVKGDCDSVRQHKEFYEEYLAVMDLPAEFYLQTIKTVFQDHALPNGTMMHRGQKGRLRGDQKEPRSLPSKARRTISAASVKPKRRTIFCPQYSGRRALSLRATGRRPLWRVQRHPLPDRDPAAHSRDDPHDPVQAADRKHVQGSRVALSQAARRTRSDHLLERSRGENRRGQGGQDPVETGRCRVKVYDLNIVILGLVPRPIVQQVTAPGQRVRLAHTR